MTGTEAIAFAFGTNSLAGYDLDAFLADTVAELTDPQKVQLLQWGMDEVARKVRQYNPSIVMTLTANVDTYSLRSTSVFSKRIVKPHYVVINGNSLLNCARSDYGMWTTNELDTVTRGKWRSLPAGTPSRPVFYDSVLLLSPKPDAACVSAGENYVAGECLPTKLIASGGGANLSAELDLIDELQYAACFLAVLKGAIPTVDSQTAWSRLAAFRSEVMESVLEARTRNSNALANWGSVERWDDDDLLIL